MKAKAWSYRDRSKAHFSGALRFARPVTAEAVKKRLTHNMGFHQYVVENMEFKPYERKEDKETTRARCAYCICSYVSTESSKAIQSLYKTAPSYVIEKLCHKLGEADCLAQLSKPICWDCFLDMLRDALNELQREYDYY